MPEELQRFLFWCFNLSGLLLGETRGAKVQNSHKGLWFGRGDVFGWDRWDDQLTQLGVTTAFNGSPTPAEDEAKQSLVLMSFWFKPAAQTQRPGGKPSLLSLLSFS